MELDALRLYSGREATIGTLGIRRGDGTRKTLAFTLEDEHRTTKVYGETRIPAGRYELRLRTWGGHHERYAQKFGNAHHGMLEITDVPGFSDVLIHIGNTDDDTAGCILLGLGADLETVTIQKSTKGYRLAYDAIVRPLLEGERVWLNVIDVDTP